MNATSSSSRRTPPSNAQLGLFGGAPASKTAARGEGEGEAQRRTLAPLASTLSGAPLAAHAAAPSPSTAPPPPRAATLPVLRVLEAAGCLPGSGPDLEARLGLSHFAVQDLAAEWEGAESTAGLATAARRVAAMLAVMWPR